MKRYGHFIRTGFLYDNYNNDVCRVVKVTVKLKINWRARVFPPGFVKCFINNIN